MEKVNKKENLPSDFEEQHTERGWKNKEEKEIKCWIQTEIGKRIGRQAGVIKRINYGGFWNSKT